MNFQEKENEKSLISRLIQKGQTVKEMYNSITEQFSFNHPDLCALLFFLITTQHLSDTQGFIFKLIFLLSAFDNHFFLYVKQLWNFEKSIPTFLFKYCVYEIIHTEDFQTFFNYDYKKIKENALLFCRNIKDDLILNDIEVFINGL